VRTAADLAQRTVLLIDAEANAGHREVARAFASGVHFTSRVWPTDHSFSDRRIELARVVTEWLRSACRLR
jgi:hypothetical protein